MRDTGKHCVASANQMMIRLAKVQAIGIAPYRPSDKSEDKYLPTFNDMC